ncbi:MAG: sulfurtransferase TusA family protein [Candidatus Thiodiazotropha sp. L084R]
MRSLYALHRSLSVSITAIQSRLRLSGTNRLRYALHGGQRAISALASGEVLEVLATDPGSVKDLDSFCSQIGNEMIASESDEDGFFFKIRKA